MSKIGIIFDMDGTLWDSSAQIPVAWNQVFADCPDLNGYQITPEELQGYMGMPMDKMAFLMMPDVPRERALEIMRRCGIVENNYLRENGAVVYEGLRETMEILRQKYHLYIVSNCQSGYVEAFLDHYGYGIYFEDILCFGDNNRQKDENIRLICERNHLDEAVYVGDIQADYNSSLRAGVKFVLADYGFGNVKEDVPKIASLRELPGCLKQIL